MDIFAVIWFDDGVIVYICMVIDLSDSSVDDWDLQINLDLRETHPHASKTDKHG